MEKKFGALSSSVNPQELSATIQGVIKTLAGTLVFFGVTTVVDMDTVIEQVTVIVPAIYAAWNSAEIIFGILRKIVVALAERFA